uniref:DUF932 domain-containing protein n=1 Tax=viral metagenome TaxID=1070528 RepID=A0A6M3IXL3_9ZZZZ
MAHEIMENDNMFSVDTIPWHGLGTILDKPPSVIEAIQAANLDWEVDLLPLLARTAPKDSPMTRLIELPERAVRRTDTGEIFSIVGPTWTPLQNREAFGVFEPLVESEDLLLETAGSLKNGRRVWVLARINADSADIGPGDEVKPYVLLSNAHDGTMAARLGFTPIRVVCNNTLSYVESSERSQLVRVIHTPKVYENIKALRDMMDLTKAAFAASVEQYRWLASRDIVQGDLERYVKIVLNPKDAEAGVAALTRTEGKVIELFESGRGHNLPKAKSWWGAYNSVTEFLSWVRGNSAENRINSLWFADGYRINERALETALKMAA